MKFVVFLVIFLLVGAFFIISNNNLHLGKSDEFHKFMNMYYGWFFKLFGNVKSISSYVINVDWMP